MITDGKTTKTSFIFSRLAVLWSQMIAELLEARRLGWRLEIEFGELISQLVDGRIIRRLFLIGLANNRTLNVRNFELRCGEIAVEHADCSWRQMTISEGWDSVLIAHIHGLILSISNAINFLTRVLS